MSRPRNTKQRQLILKCFGGQLLIPPLTGYQQVRAVLP